MAKVRQLRNALYAKRHYLAVLIALALVLVLGPQVKRHFDLLGLRVPYELLESRLLEVHLALEQYRGEHSGRLPRDVNQLLELGYLKHWPENPFDPGQPMKPLRPDDPYEPGGFVYIGWGPALGTEAGVMPDTAAITEDQLVTWQDTMGNTYSAALHVPTRPELPVEVWEYALLAYGPIGRVRSSEVKRWVTKSWPGKQVLDSASLDWSQVAAFRTWIDLWARHP